MKVVVLFAEGYEELEALATVDVLRRAQIEVSMIGTKESIVKSTRSIDISMNGLLECIKAEEVDMLVLPGGMPGVKNLYEDECVRDFIQKCYDQNKWIGAICAAPSILGKMNLLEGKKATCYPGFEKDLKGATLTQERVVIDGKIITGIGAGASLEFAFTLLDLLKGKEIANTIKQGMMFKE